MLFFRMALVNSSNKERFAPIMLCQLHKFKIMLGTSFEGWILKRYGLYDVVSNAYRYIHCDLIDTTRYFITITYGHWIYICSYIFELFECWGHILRFLVCNNIHKKIWEKILKDFNSCFYCDWKHWSFIC
jgi:hypothetical protein